MKNLTTERIEVGYACKTGLPVVIPEYFVQEDRRVGPVFRLINSCDAICVKIDEDL